ncbi:hypothetical protein COLO4_01907 [Corchorus olitorius]|uniref:Uncharacterized protein n=1 Tax=Corchorus olitorius TaxID=93759 RepID=A0A1R3L1S8_9ROSI|nr:hypothetical protein COLO4_01907 [Corchorus olitorius]
MAGVRSEELFTTCSFAAVPEVPVTSIPEVVPVILTVFTVPPLTSA